MSEDYQTVKEVIIQMLASPAWKNQYNSFVDEYCIYFDDDEENSFQQNNLFKQFQKEMAAVYDSFFNSLGLENSEDLQMKVITEILNSDGDDDIDIEQLLALGDFQVFKAEMSLQNKKREMAAYQQLVDEDDDEQENDEEDDTESSKMEVLKIKLEYEQMQEELELKQAMQLSMDTPSKKIYRVIDENKMKAITHILGVVSQRLEVLELEEEEIQQQEQIQQAQNNDRKAKLVSSLNRLPPLDLQKEIEILTKIKLDADKL